MYQKIILVGNLGNQPELRYTASGEAVCNFSLATNRQWKNSDGEKVKEVTWFRISAWGKQAEAVNQYLEKGGQVFVEGTLQPDPDTGGPRIWEDDSGNARASFEVRAYQVKFLGGKSDFAPEGDSSSAPSSASTATISADEIPF